MPVSEYKHVYKRGQGDRPWWAYVHGEYLGAYAQKDQAAQAVAYRLGETKKSSLRVRPPKRTHRYVYWHHARAAWQVKIGDEFLGILATHNLALARIFEKTGLTPDELEMGAEQIVAASSNNSSSSSTGCSSSRSRTRTSSSGTSKTNRSSLFQTAYSPPQHSDNMPKNKNSSSRKRLRPFRQ